MGSSAAGSPLEGFPGALVFLGGLVLWWAVIAVAVAGVALTLGCIWSYRRLKKRLTPDQPGADDLDGLVANQALGILVEALNGPWLCKATKKNLLHLMLRHRGHPERALLEHLQQLRAGATERSR
ncbi:hypothetical protein [Sinomonas sp. G460-2]|uniref:hypothetical protein n=1 Tax=Sinomonas sp. G460-2 TaxID=3393464 RepID=UPI0039EFF6EB